jgi:hypothetical protein
LSWPQSTGANKFIINPLKNKIWKKRFNLPDMPASIQMCQVLRITLEIAIQIRLKKQLNSLVGYGLR